MPANTLKLSLSLLLGLILWAGQAPTLSLADEPIPLASTAAWVSDERDYTVSVAWGDVDGDGDLDLAVGNYGQRNKVYLNQGGVLASTAAWVSDEADWTESVAWGDVDGDGDLDLAVGNGNFYDAQANKVYLNQGGVLESTAAWVSADEDYTESVAWGDVDGDGDLDLAVGNYLAPNKVYLNQGGVLASTAAWVSDDAGLVRIAWPGGMWMAMAILISLLVMLEATRST